MKKIFILIVASLLGSGYFAQNITYDFSTDPLVNGWTRIHTSGGAATGFTHSLVNQNINYDITTGTANNFLRRTTPYTLGNQFSISFRIRPAANNSNTFFPLLLTPSEVTGTDIHPWRLNPVGGGAGALQNIDLLGVGILGTNVHLVNRLGNNANCLTPFTNALNLTANTDYWIKLERICATTVRLSVYSNAAMTTVLRDEYFTIPNLAAMNHLYIANCNGNFSTSQRGILDDYTIDQPDNICCSPSQIEGDNVICSTSGPSTFSAAISGNNIQNANWTISPAGPTFTQTTTNGYSMTVSNWNQPGTYTITFTWTCNCTTQTLTKVVTVQNPINTEDYVGINSSCTELANSHAFTVTANGVSPQITRNWEVFLAANSTIGDYTTSGVAIMTFGNVASVNMNSLPNTNSYIIKCHHGYLNGVCPSEVVQRKSICASGKSTLAVSENNPVVYPNPAQKEINIELPEMHSIKQVQIIDLNGRIVLETIVNANDRTITFDIQKLVNGVYTIVYVSKEAYTPEKFIKE